MFLLWIDLAISVFDPYIVFPILWSAGRAAKFGISIFAPRNSGCVVGDGLDFSTLIMNPTLVACSKVMYWDRSVTLELAPKLTNFSK